MNTKKIVIQVVVIVAIIFALFALQMLFASLSLAAWGGIGGVMNINVFIITCVFVSVWLLVLFLAAILKSKALINTHLCYWLVIICAFLLLFIIGQSLNYGMLWIVSFFLVFPIFGIQYLFSNDILGLTDLIIPLTMLLLGLFIKYTFIKKLPGRQSEHGVNHDT